MDIWLPIVISSFSLIVAIGSTVIAWQSHRDSRLMAKLSLRPRIIVRSEFGKNDELWGVLKVSNPGPLDAAQVTIEMLQHSYKEFQNSRTRTSLTGIDIFTEDYSILEISGENNHRWQQPKLAALEKLTIQIPLDILAFPEIGDVLEARFTYYRSADFQKYQSSAFYFVAESGEWVPEYHPALNTQYFERAKSEITSASSNITLEQRGDFLHSK